MLRTFAIMILATMLTAGPALAEAPATTVSRPARVSSTWVPLWAKKAVWYQIFPERFRNGDPSNDPRLEDTKGSWPHDSTSPWHVSPWTSDWYELQPWEKLNGKDVWFNIQRRRYGGDLQGVLDKLDYLQKLGVNAIYLNPVFASPSLHKYDGLMYHHIDPNFGPDPEGDRRLIDTEDPGDPATWHWTAADKLALRLVSEVHRRHMHIIFDGVFNHIGMASPFFQDVVKHQQQSKYKDWFDIKSWEDPVAGTHFDYNGWFGVKELPDWRQDQNGIVPGPKDYIFAITRRWMAPDDRVADGIDGWRLDVAYCVKHPFWKDWSRLVRRINPRAYMTAEVIDTVEANKPFLQGDEFTAVMNYNFAFATSEFFIDRKHRISASEFDRRLRTLREAYAPSIAYGMQNLFDSHDTARLASNIVNRDRVEYRDWPKYCDLSKGSDRQYRTTAPDEDDRRVQRLMVLFQMTYVGAPMIYYGDEAGMWGANDPDCRKPMVWDDLHYRDEAYLPDGSLNAKPDRVAFDHDLFAWYQKLIAIRRGSDALQLGAFKTLLTDDAHGIYSFLRSQGPQQVVVVLNNSQSGRTCHVSVPPGTYRDMLQNRTLSARDGRLNLFVGSVSGAILERQP